MSINLSKLNGLPKTVVEQVKDYVDQIECVSPIENSPLLKDFEREKERLELKGIKVSVRYMFHLTDTQSAKLIRANGFNPQLSFYKAFGKGVNLCTKMDGVIKYKRMRKSDSKKVSIFITKVLVGRSHGNSSDDSDIVRDSNGASYSRPKHMMPKKGYDCMYSLDPYKEIWIVPSKRRVIPVAEIQIRD